MHGNEIALLNYDLKGVFTKDTAEGTYGDFCEAVGYVVISQAVCEFETANHAIEYDHREIELHVVFTNAYLTVLQQFCLLVYLDY